MIRSSEQETGSSLMEFLSGATTTTAGRFATVHAHLTGNIDVINDDGETRMERSPRIHRPLVLEVGDHTRIVLFRISVIHHGDQSLFTTLKSCAYTHGTHNLSPPTEVFRFCQWPISHSEDKTLIDKECYDTEVSI